MSIDMEWTDDHEMTRGVFRKLQCIDVVVVQSSVVLVVAIWLTFRFLDLDREISFRDPFDLISESKECFSTTASLYPITDVFVFSETRKLDDLRPNTER